MKLAKLALPLTLFTACGADGSLAGAGSTNVTQGGAKDIALFRQMVARGEVPAPEVLDEVGFFAEHALDLPPANCGSDVCVHPMLAVAPTFDDKNWTMAFVAMNSAVKAANLARPAVHLVLAIEDTDDYEIQGGLIEGVNALIGALRPEDRVSMLVYNGEVEVIARRVEASAELSERLENELRRYETGPAAMYEALAVSSQLLDEAVDFEGARRIVLVSSGRADSGITDPSRIVALVEGLAKEEVSLSVITTPPRREAVVDLTLTKALGRIGAGTLAAAESGIDLAQLLHQEGETSLFPLATDLEIRIEAARGYRIGRTYGAPNAKVEGNVAILRSPAIFLGLRQGADDVVGGRRGGGGGLFVELIAEPLLQREIGAHAPAFAMTARFVESRSSQARTQARDVRNPLPPGKNPPPSWPFFSEPTQGKAFMMLNMYLALRTAVDFHHSGDCARAKGLIDLVSPMVDLWLATEPDVDLSDDYALMKQLRANLETSCQALPPMIPQQFSGGCFGL